MTATVMEAGLMEKMDLKESLIGHTPDPSTTARTKEPRLAPTRFAEGSSIFEGRKNPPQPPFPKGGARGDCFRATA
jgi:hypothetical protein